MILLGVMGASVIFTLNGDSAFSTAAIVATIAKAYDALGEAENKQHPIL